MIVELKQNDEVSTLFVKYSGDDTIATGAKFKQKFTAFRLVTTNDLQLDISNKIIAVNNHLSNRKADE